jgi:hypothetical protein
MKEKGFITLTSEVHGCDVRPAGGQSPLLSPSHFSVNQILKNTTNNQLLTNHLH